MKKSDYKNHLDRIRCSAEFRKKMEKRLANEPDGEYEDSVSDIEHAPRINYHRLTAFVASAVLVAGIGGMSLLIRSDICEVSTGSEISEPSESSSASTEISVQRAIEINPVNQYNIALSVSGDFSEPDGHSMPFGSLPDEAVNEIIAEIEKWSELQDTSAILSEPTGTLTFYFIGDDNFTLKIDSNGSVVVKRDDDENILYYSQECYLSLLEIIAGYIPYCDWSTIINEDIGDEINMVFRNHVDEIEITDNYDSEVGLRFFASGSYSGTINENGDIKIYYNNEQELVCFKSSPELYSEIYEVLNNNLAYMIAEKDTMFYSNSTGQSAEWFGFQNVNTDILCNAVKSLDWCISAGEYPTGEFFGIGNLMIQRDGSIYNSDTGVLYVPTNQNNSEIINAVEEIIKSDDLGYICYLVASSESRFDTMSGNIYYSCKDVIDGTGELYYDNKNMNEYVYIEDENNNSAMLRMENNFWTVYYTRDGVTETDESSGFMGHTMIDYKYIKDYFSSSLRDVYNAYYGESDITVNLLNITKETDYLIYNVEYVYKENCTSIQANIDDYGNIVSMSLYQYDINTNETNQQLIFSIDDGYGNGINYNDKNMAEKYNFN